MALPNAYDIEPMPGEDPFNGEDPIPLTQSGPIPRFPADALPAPVAAMCRAVSEATQTDLAMSSVVGLAALSACTGGHAEIEIRSGWREPLNLYTAVIAESGERKSSVLQTMVRPVLDAEQRMASDGEAARLEAETRKQIATRAAEKERQAAAAKAGTDDWDSATANAVGAAMIADQIEVPPIPRLVADDVTPEAAASLLAEQGGRLAIISAEGGIFDIIAGRYSNNVPNMDLWLKGHSGDLIRIDRKGRPPEYIRRPALTLGLMIQRTVLSTIAGNRQFRGRGFLARFLYAYPVSKVGRREIAPPPVEDEVRTRYEDAVAALVAGMSEWGGDPAVLTLTETGGRAMTEIEAAVEPTLAGNGELAALTDWGSKYVGAVARIAGILHLAEHGAETGPRTPVSAQTVLAASRIGDYFKASAIKAFSEMGTDQVIADAHYLLTRIRNLGAEEVSERDLHAASSRAKFAKKNDLRPPLERLVEHGYLAPMKAAGPTGGRPASPRFKVHPLATKATEYPKGS